MLCTTNLVRMWKTPVRTDQDSNTTHGELTGLIWAVTRTPGIDRLREGFVLLSLSFRTMSALLLSQDSSETAAVFFARFICLDILAGERPEVAIHAAIERSLSQSIIMLNEECDLSACLPPLRRSASEFGSDVPFK